MCGLFLIQIQYTTACCSAKHIQSTLFLLHQKEPNILSESAVSPKQWGDYWFKKENKQTICKE